MCKENSENNDYFQFIVFLKREKYRKIKDFEG